MGTRKRNAGLLLVSFLILFLEITLIRWIATEIRIFAYVSNLVLLACFLGIGIGCYYPRSQTSVMTSLLALLALLWLVNAPISIQLDGQRLHLAKDIPTLLSLFTDSVIWYESKSTAQVLKVILGMLSTFTVVGLIIASFVPLGQILGGLLNQYENLVVAYSLNIVGSLLGIWAFNILSFQSAPPWTWFSVTLVAMVVLLAWRSSSIGWWNSMILAGHLMMLMVLSSNATVKNGTTTWSPYQKLHVRPLEPVHLNRGHLLTVNDVGYMEMLDLSDEFTSRRTQYADLERRSLSNYDLPYQFKPDPGNVLIVGAGAGNDAAGAIRNGAQRITAVEIDPAIIALGSRLHPESPYSHPTVDVVIDDARSFLKRTTKRYDLIVFASLDAHTLVSSFNNMRVDHYVYTRESFREARQLLKDDGVLAVIFTPQRSWIRNRIAGLLRHVFDQEPVNLRAGVLGWGSHMFVVSNNMERVKQTISSNTRLSRFVATNRISAPEPVRLTTDDWPYLYLEKPSVPTLHLCLSGILLVICVLLKRFMITKDQRINWHFFLLGAAFLLLEFQNISKTTLLFGSTWLVNSFTLSGILTLILIANVIAYRWKNINVKILYVCLIASVGIAYFVPLTWFNTFSYWPRIVLSSVLLNLPILFAGIVFIHSFRTVRSPNAAFGANLLGAGVGGILESASFVTGIHMLLVFVAILYVGSFLTLPNGGRD